MVKSHKNGSAVVEVGSTVTSPSLVSVGNGGNHNAGRGQNCDSLVELCSIASFSFLCPRHLTWSFLVLHVLMEAPAVLPVIFLLAASVHQTSG